MKKSLLSLIFLNVSLCQTAAANWDLVLIPSHQCNQTTSPKGFQLFYDAGHFRVGSLEVGMDFPPGIHVLHNFSTDAGNVYHVFPRYIGETIEISNVGKILYRNGEEAIIQATFDQLRKLPRQKTEWVLITLTPKPLNHASGFLSARDGFNLFIESLVEQVSQAYYANYMQTLEDFVSRNTFTTTCDNAAAWILSQFATYGLVTYYHEFEINGYTKYNVVGELTGTVYPDSVFFITAHYDATAGFMWEPESVAPGANDNGSGVACVLECARILSNYRFEKTIRFVAFCAEEQGLVGSYAYTDYLQNSGDAIAGSFNLDMISYAPIPDPLWGMLIIADENPNSQRMSQRVNEALAVFVPEFIHGIVVVQPMMTGSDHSPFWVHGWPATYTSQWAVYPLYHTVNDLSIHQNYEYAACVTQAHLAALADFAGLAGTEVSGSASGLWTSEGNPYIVTDSIWVPEYSMLTIDEGVYITFNGDYSFNIQEGAALQANGTCDLPIIITTTDPEITWQGLRFQNSNNDSRLTFCRIENSSADGQYLDAFGGAVYLDNCNATIEHCVISHCRAERGGAIYCYNESDAYMQFNTICGNAASQGGAIFCYNSSPTISNSIFWNNGSEQVALWGNSNPSITYCNVEGGWPGEGNIDQDPCFVDEATGNYMLQSYVGSYSSATWAPDSLYSPCIDAGNIATCISEEPEPNGDRVNIGTYGGTALASFSKDDPQYVWGDETGTWELENSPIQVVGNIRIPADETLDIEPAVEVIFNGNYSIEVMENAQLFASGTIEDTIKFFSCDGEIHWGGIRFIESSDNSRLEYCYLKDCNNLNGGAVYCNLTDPNFSHCLFENCSATYGGAIYLDNANAIISDCSFNGNHASGGGGIYSSASDLMLLRNVFSANTGGNGAAIYLFASEGSIENNLMFENNASGQGGGIYGLNSSALILNSTIVENMASNGSGIFLIGDGEVGILNSIVWGNNDDQIAVGNGEAPEVTFSCIQNEWPGEGNIDEYPEFVIGSLSEYHLAPTSPCIDAGNPNVEYNDPENPLNPGYALYPASGTIRNDMGIYGGGASESWVGVSKPSSIANIPEGFKLHRSYPNPFNPTTIISFELPVAGSVKMDVFDINGRVVEAISPQAFTPGIHTITFDGSSLSSGIYLYRLTAGNFVGTGKMVLVK